MASRIVTIQQYKKRFIALVKHPFFWVLTIVGNSTILIGALLIYWRENLGPAPIAFLDSLLWSTGLVTTIGYGNYTPQTSSGKIIVIVLMMTGTLFVWSYMAFLVTGIMAPEISSLEKDVHDVEREIRDLKKGPDGTIS